MKKYSTEDVTNSTAFQVFNGVVSLSADWAVSGTLGFIMGTSVRCTSKNKFVLGIGFVGAVATGTVIGGKVNNIVHDAIDEDFAPLVAECLNCAEQVKEILHNSPEEA